MARFLGGKVARVTFFHNFQVLTVVNIEHLRIRSKRYINKNGAVDIEWTFKYGNGGTRPTEIIYDVFQGGQKILGGIFGN